VVNALGAHDVTSEVVRVVDHTIRFGVTIEEGVGDEWPMLREKVVAADILVVATPICMGQRSSVCTMVLEHVAPSSARPTRTTTWPLAANTAHLVRILRTHSYPVPG
jgi:multimeric flavodoxin WrbA